MEVAHYTYSAMALNKYRILKSGMARHGDQLNTLFKSSRQEYDWSYGVAAKCFPQLHGGSMYQRSGLCAFPCHALRRAHEQAECRHGAS